MDLFNDTIMVAMTVFLKEGQSRNAHGELSNIMVLPLKTVSASMSSLAAAAYVPIRIRRHMSSQSALSWAIIVALVLRAASERVTLRVTMSSEHLKRPTMESGPDV